jgi:hypothetical protein
MFLGRLVYIWSWFRPIFLKLTNFTKNYKRLQKKVPKICENVTLVLPQRLLAEIDNFFQKTFWWSIRYKFIQIPEFFLKKSCPTSEIVILVTFCPCLPISHELFAVGRQFFSKKIW